MLSTFKQSLLDRAVAEVKKNLWLERRLCDGCALPFLRNQLKLGAIAYHYLTSFEHPEWRIARLDSYQLWVNIAEYQGLWLYFFREDQEPRSTRLATELIREGDTCLDVGANMGSYTFLMASRVGDRGRVFAFEPQPNLYQKLDESRYLNKFEDRLTLDTRVLSDRAKEKVKFYLSTDARNSGMASLLCHHEYLEQDRFIEAETITLTDYFAERAIEHCDLLKIDVECAELAVLQGAIDLLKSCRIRYLIIEQANGSDSQKFLQACDYSGWAIDEAKPQLVPLNRVAPGAFGNYLFISPLEVENFTQNYSCLVNS